MSEVGKVSLGIELGGKKVEKQAESVAAKLGQRFSKALKTSFQGVMKGFRASAKTIPAPEPKIDVKAAKAEIEQLTAVLDNVNARLEFQKRKLADLKKQHKNTFNEAKKTKLEGQILSTEATILRLEKQSDSTAAKIWKLEDSIKEAGQAAQQTKPPVTNLDKRLKNTNRTLKTADRQMKTTTKNASNLGRAMKTTGKRATGMGNQFTQAFKRIARQVLVFSVIYKAIRGFQDYMGNSLRTNEQYAKSLNAIKTNMLTAFQPIYQAILPAINALMAGLAKATAYIAAFVSALFGKTYKQSYEAAKGLQEARKAMDGYGKSAKKTSQQMASFDELNLLDTSTGEEDVAGAGGDMWEMEMPELDIDSIQTQMDALALSVRTTFDRTFSAIRTGWDWAMATFGPGIQKAWGVVQPELAKWKEQFGVMFSDIVSLGEPLKNWWQSDLLPLWEQSTGKAAMIFSGLSESVRMVFDSIWAAAFPIIEKFVTDGLPRITEFASAVQGIFSDMFDVVKDIFDDIWMDVIDPAMELISQIIQDTLDIIFDWWDEWGTKIVISIRETLSRIKELWDSLWNRFLKPIVTKMLDTMKRLWDEHLKGLVKEVGNFVGKLTSAALDILNKFILPIVNWLVKTLGPVFAEIFGLIIDILGNVLGIIIDIVAGIIKALGGVIDFIAGVFTGDWKRAWNGIATVFEGIADAIDGIFKGVINSIIDAMNWMIRQVNRIKIDIPEWVPKVGGETFGLNIPTIPRLAKGGLVQGPTLAMVGDNPHANVDPEVVSPLSKLQELLGGANQETVEVLYMILAALQNLERRPVILEANGTQLAKVVDDARDDRNRRAGRTLAMT